MQVFIKNAAKSNYKPHFSINSKGFGTTHPGTTDVRSIKAHHAELQILNKGRFWNILLGYNSISAITTTMFSNQAFNEICSEEVGKHTLEFFPKKKRHPGVERAKQILLHRISAATLELAQQQSNQTIKNPDELHAFFNQHLMAAGDTATLEAGIKLYAA